MKKALYIILALVTLSACTKVEEPKQPLRKGINVIKTTPVTKSADADTTKAEGRPAHLPIAPVYGEQK